MTWPKEGEMPIEICKKILGGDNSMYWCNYNVNLTEETMCMSLKDVLDEVIAIPPECRGKIVRLVVTVEVKNEAS